MRRLSGKYKYYSEGTHKWWGMTIVGTGLTYWQDFNGREMQLTLNGYRPTDNPSDRSSGCVRFFYISKPSAQWGENDWLYRLLDSCNVYTPTIYHYLWERMPWGRRALEPLRDKLSYYFITGEDTNG